MRCALVCYVSSGCFDPAFGCQSPKTFVCLFVTFTDNVQEYSLMSRPTAWLRVVVMHSAFAAEALVTCLIALFFWRHILRHSSTARRCASSCFSAKFPRPSITVDTQLPRTGMHLSDTANYTAISLEIYCERQRVASCRWYPVTLPFPSTPSMAP